MCNSYRTCNRVTVRMRGMCRRKEPAWLPSDTDQLSGMEASNDREKEPTTGSRCNGIFELTVFYMQSGVMAQQLQRLTSDLGRRFDRLPVHSAVTQRTTYRTRTHQEMR